MELPKNLGNRIRITEEDNPLGELPQAVKQFSDGHGFRMDLEVYGRSFYKSITVPSEVHVNRAFELDVGDRCISPQYMRIDTDQQIEIKLNCGAAYIAQHIVLPGSFNLDFSQFFIESYRNFWVDVENLGEGEAHVSCYLMCHIYCRPGDMLWDSFRAAHIETSEEKAAREERERIAHEARMAAEAKAWEELGGMIGEDAAEHLKVSRQNWYAFTGSNGNEFAINGYGELASMTTATLYCVQLSGVPYNLPIPDVIMEKIKWCQLNADEVETKANDIGTFDCKESNLYREKIKEAV